MTDTAAPRPAGFSWFQALDNQAKVIGALLMRELHTRYGRDNVGYLWMILEPMLFAVAVALIHYAQPSHTASDVNAVAFGALGYTIFIMFRGMFTRAEGAIEANAPLLYHRMVTVFDMLFARAILEACGTSVTFFLMLAFGIAVGLCNVPYRIEYLLGGLAFMAWFGFAMSICCCAITHDNKLVARLVHPISYILMPLSGAFYMVSWIPQSFRETLLWFPMPHIFEMARYGQFRAAPGDYFSIPYLTMSCMILTLLGLLGLKIVRRHIHLH